MKTMASSVTVIPSRQHHMDRLDAARALLGVSPVSQTPECDLSPNTSRLSAASVSFGSTSFRRYGQANNALKPQEHSPASLFAAASEQSNVRRLSGSRTVSFEKQLPSQASSAASPLFSSSSGLNGLDALAALASSEQASLQQPLAPQQQQQQARSDPFDGPSPSLIVSAIAGNAHSSLTVSASTTTASSSSSDDDSEAMPPPPPRAGGRRRSVSNPEGMEKWARPSSSRKHFVLPASILEEELAEASAAMEARERICHAATGEGPSDAAAAGSDENSQEGAEAPTSLAPISGLMSEEEQANLTPEELLKRARSRLLEDLSEGSLNGEKGVLTLPHSLSKYKEVYNKNGRIGIYTPAERSAIIARFQSKRSRRVWNKKIRYNCRKNLADRRMRVKGRFVKRSTEEQAKAEAAAADVMDTNNPAADETTPEPSETADEDMPDVTDPEAGFCPTDDQPYRRTRRHTIT